MTKTALGTQENPYKLYEKEGLITYRKIIGNLRCLESSYVDTNQSGIVTVSTKYDDNNVYYLQYEEISHDYIDNLMVEKVIIDLEGKYIKNFDFNKLNPTYRNNFVFFRASFSYFDGNTSFRNVKFGDRFVTFQDTRFGDGSIDFRHTEFGNETTAFFRATFGKGDLSFYGATFGYGEVDFNFTTFNKSYIGFSHATFKSGKINFTCANFNNSMLDFYLAHFGEGNLTFLNSNLKNGLLNFAYATHGSGTLDFNAISVGSIVFNGNTFVSDINLLFDSINNLYFYRCVNKSYIKIGNVTNSLSLYESTNIARMKIDWDDSLTSNLVREAYFNPIDYSKEMIIGEDTFVSKECIGDIENSLKLFNLKEFPIKNKYSEVSKDFLLLKENYRKAGQYEWEDAAYRAYMEYSTKAIDIYEHKEDWKDIEDKEERKSKKKIVKKEIRQRRRKKNFNKLFGAISGYGTMPDKILWACFWNFAIAGVVFTLALLGDKYAIEFKNMIPLGEYFKNMLEGFYFSAITFLTIGYGETLKIVSLGWLNWLVRIVACIEGFLGLFFMSILTVTVMRKVLR